MTPPSAGVANSQGEIDDAVMNDDDQGVDPENTSGGNEQAESIAVPATEAEAGAVQPNNPLLGEEVSGGASSSAVVAREENHSQEADIDQETFGGESDAVSSDDDDDYETHKIKTMNRTSLEAKMLNLVGNMEEAKEAQKINGHHMLKMLKQKADAIENEDEKSAEKKILSQVLGTYNKYREIFKNEAVVYKYLSQVFKCEYDSRVNIPNEIKAMEEEMAVVQEALDDIAVKEQRAKQMKSQGRVLAKQKLVQKQAREQKKRNIEALNDEVESWGESTYKRKASGKSPMGKSPIGRSPYRS